MSEIVTTANTSYLLLVAASAIVCLLVLIVKLKLHAFIALILVSVLTAFAAGIPSNELIPTMTKSFGSTLAAVALLVGLGAMIAKILEVSGGAQVLADTLISKFGTEKAPLALGISALIFGFPIFFDAGLIVMLPIIFSVAKRFNGPILIYALPVAGALAVMHAFVPPHPGPVVAAGFLNADISVLLLVGLFVALPTWYLGAYIFGIYVGKKYSIDWQNTLLAHDPSTKAKQTPPKFSNVLLILLLPVVLIAFNTVCSTLIAAQVIQSDSTFIAFIQFIGNTPIALLTTLLLCLIMFSQRYSMQALQDLCESSLKPICSVILITGAGGMFGGVLRASGIGDALANSLQTMGLPIIVVAFVIASCIRVAQGSATVALTTTAALLSPVVISDSSLTSIDLSLIVIAIACGATVLSHFNDSGFWLVSRLFNMDEKTTLKTWTVMVTLLGLIGFVLSALLSVIL
ncbi:GntP family permease [Glaciecola petra]|uniref:GntP family permease n=1 Tax=Glaciecola petra TaxID=3075602 RepID=A0ABU2ZS32_9ALTE|nr:GntP family permease [Aestuariibacter sp. P117]MDT0595440.1 GntP family permease [Aestuariibacter sp. P117]